MKIHKDLPFYDSKPLQKSSSCVSQACWRTDSQQLLFDLLHSAFSSVLNQMIGPASLCQNISRESIFLWRGHATTTKAQCWADWEYILYFAGNANVYWYNICFLLMPDKTSIVLLSQVTSSVPWFPISFSRKPSEPLITDLLSKECNTSPLPL